MKKSRVLSPGEMTPRSTSSSKSTTLRQNFSPAAVKGACEAPQRSLSHSRSRPPKRTIGIVSPRLIFPDCRSVSTSKSSSKVPKPPGQAIRARLGQHKAYFCEKEDRHIQVKRHCHKALTHSTKKVMMLKRQLGAAELVEPSLKGELRREGNSGRY